MHHFALGQLRLRLPVVVAHLVHILRLFVLFSLLLIYHTELVPNRFTQTHTYLRSLTASPIRAEFERSSSFARNELHPTYICTSSQVRTVSRFRFSLSKKAWARSGVSSGPKWVL